MKLTYQSEYKSVKIFNEIEIQDFAFFTGKNGSGKTHLLQAIKEGNVSVNGFPNPQILYLNYLDFAHNFQIKTDYSHKINAWNRLSLEGNNLVSQLKNQEGEIESFKLLIEKTAEEKDKAIFDLKPEDFLSGDGVSVVAAVGRYKDNLETLLFGANYLADEIAQSIFDSVICRTKIFLSNLTENEFKILFQKTAISNRNILSDLSNIFFEYYKNIKRNELNQLEGKVFLCPEEFKRKNGPPPWDLVRNIFMGFGLNFDVNDPMEENIDVFDGAFQISFKHTQKGNRLIPFEDLSSGEKILITLINAVYTANRKNGLPKLILLDEIDGPLNPSIISNFIFYLQDNFFKNGVKLIVATHSPTTVAFAPEGSVYMIDTNSAVPVSPITNKGAVKTLSEGFITLSDLLEFENIATSKVIISEGKNYKYLEKSKNLFATDSDLSILHIRNLGSGQLRTLFDFMRVFNQQKQFIFVWDSDYRFDKDGDLKKLNLNSKVNKNNQIFIFNRNPKGVVTEGIENLINLTDCSDYQGGYKEDSSSPKNKEHFQNYVLRKTDLGTVLLNLKPLFDFATSTSANHNL